MRIKGVSIKTFHIHEKLSPISEIRLVFKNAVTFNLNLIRKGIKLEIYCQLTPKEKNV